MRPVYSYLRNFSWKKDEYAGIVFFLKLIIFLFLLKLLFFFYNESVFNPPVSISVKALFLTIKWSFFYDTLVLLAINFPFVLCLWAVSYTRQKNALSAGITAIFLLINLICVLLNVADVFYYHFHLQRANADLFYVIQHAFEKTFLHNLLPTMFAVGALIAILYLLWKIHRPLMIAARNGHHFLPVLSLMLLGIIMFFSSGRKKLVPTYPLTEISNAQVIMAQNSLHTFLYSVYRREEGMVSPLNYVKRTEGKALFNVKRIACDSLPNGPRNIMLFIMESIPEDFFNPTSPYKVAMPFLDSLVEHSAYFSNAYSYSHNSNKGIVAILAGIPTLTEIPLYHSNYASLKMTPVGAALSEKGYETSFFIGDHYDDFGFAKCANWLGIQRYYSREDMTEENGETHTMGLHDAYVLNFMGKKIREMKTPFFAINYNISTHYPYDLPKSYVEKFPAQNVSDQMKSMNYYNESLEMFFTKAAKEAWYQNTVFIFCSDHWLYPDRPVITDPVESFRIPIIIHEPSLGTKKQVVYPVSQLDILNTILCIAGVEDTVYSYGENLLTDLDPGRIVFCKQNSTLVQAIDSSYVLGFNSALGTVEYCYNFKSDKVRLRNLASTNNVKADSMAYKIKCFLQEASYHYNRLGIYR